MKILRNILRLIFIIVICGASYATLFNVFRPNGEIEVNGEKRTYTIHKPKAYKNSESNYPVLFVLHGNPSKSWELKHYTGMNRTADKNGFIVVYPDALDHSWDFLNKRVVEEEIDYIELLLEKIKLSYRVDESKVYVSGISGGGIFSFILGNALAGEIAAICVVAGNMIHEDQFPIEINNHPMPLILVHGTADFLYPGREDLMSVEKTLDYWTSRNKCDANPFITPIADRYIKDHTRAEHLFYKSVNKADISFYRIENGGHHWPNSTFDSNFFVKRDLGKLNRDFETNQVIWDFLSNYSIN